MQIESLSQCPRERAAPTQFIALCCIQLKFFLRFTSLPILRAEFGLSGDQFLLKISEPAA